jgi:glutamate racemase
VRNGPIGIFDSGIGGLTVMKEMLSLLPDESFVYLGDTARVPYGTKSSETVVRFTRESLSFLRANGVKLIVVACNTASAEALPRLEGEFDVPLVGVIAPGIEAALKASRNMRIGVIGTAGTIRSGAYQEGISRLEPGAVVRAKPCPLFVPLAEEGWVDDEVTAMVAQRYLEEYRHNGIDTLVLGCTHYPLLRDVISRAVGERVTLVDSAVETARRVAEILEEKALLRGEGGGEFAVYLTDVAPSFREVGERFLGRPIPEIRLINGRQGGK